MIVRSSSLSRLMTNPRSKKEVLSETAKSYIKEIAYQDFFGIRKHISTREMEKGNMCEQDVIDLLNIVAFENYVKSDAKGNNGWLSGHPDILNEDEVIDIKTSWSFETFPFLAEDVKKEVKSGGYEWQIRAYMMLFNKDKGKVVFGLVDTPDELLTDYDDESIHKVSHIEPNKRISQSITFYRDLEIEKQVKERYDAGKVYYDAIINELKSK